MSGREITMTRIYDAPRELVFDVWTDPAHLAKWWGPDGFTSTFQKMEVKPGGEWEMIMHGPDGTDYKNKSIFKEVVRPERLVYYHITAPKFTGTVTFEDQDGKTKLTMQMLFDTTNDYDMAVNVFGAIEGAKQHMERLGAYLLKQKQ